MSEGGRFYEAPSSSLRRSAPAALRNRQPIAEVLGEWLPPSGLVLEIASGTGEHAVYFAERFADLEWQPSDIHPDALASIAACREESGPANLRSPIVLDASAAVWPIDRADAVLSIKMDSDSCDDAKPTAKGGFDVVLNLNMVHISPWIAALGLLDGAARVLKPGGALILYGPWLRADVETAPSNVAFDQQLRERAPEWGLRRVEDFDAAASDRGFQLEQTRAMPANNLMLLFRLAC
jgi:SAM-dependent methyltransferase